jgi:hypothetical protein
VDVDNTTLELSIELSDTAGVSLKDQLRYGRNLSKVFSMQKVAEKLEVLKLKAAQKELISLHTHSFYSKKINIVVLH